MRVMVLLLLSVAVVRLALPVSLVKLQKDGRPTPTRRCRSTISQIASFFSVSTALPWETIAFGAPVQSGGTQQL